MKKIFLLMLVCIATSCSSYKGMTTVDNDLRKVNIGMSKKKVISIMGDDYEVISSKAGTFTLGYKSTTGNEMYKLVFVDDKLMEWNKERLINNRSANSKNKDKK